MICRLRLSLLALSLSLLGLGLPLLAQSVPQLRPNPPRSAQAPRVAIDTEFGTIELVLDAAHAPRTTANFLRYVDAGAYSGGRFHRTVTLANQPQNPVKIEVIQGGAAREDQDVAPLALERTRETGLRHGDGTISMARDTPDSATSDFFLCLGDQPALDFAGKRHPDGQGFAAFGKVSKGMDLVRRIQARPAQGQTLTPPVKIIAVRRL